MKPRKSTEHGNSNDQQFAQLAAELRRKRPRPTPQFASRMQQRFDERLADLDDKADQPFEKKRDRRWLGRFQSLRPARTLPALAVAASLLIAVSIGVTLLKDPLGDKKSGQPAQAGPTQAPPAQAPRALAPSIPESQAGNSAASPRELPAFGRKSRRVEANALLTLGAQSNKIQEVADQIVQTTDQHRGVVIRSDITTDSKSGNGATFALRVPVSELKATLADLSKLGSVLSRKQSTVDVTGRFNSTRARLNDLRAERASLLRRLSGADSQSQAAQLREQLRQVTYRIANTKSKLDNLSQRTAYSQIDVTLKPYSQAGSDSGKSGWGVADAARDSLYFTVQVVNFAIRFLGILIPLLAIGIGTWWLGRAAIRYRRDAPLRQSGQDGDNGSKSPSQ